MTVQALYHYFPRRDDLVTALIVDAYNDLADTVDAAASAAGTSRASAVAGVAMGYRQWALDHPHLFQLIYGSPLRG